MTVAGRSDSASDEWGRGWTLVLAAFVGFSFLSIVTGSFSLFIEPVAQEFGWSRTATSSGFTVAALLTALLSPFFGILVDRYGPRRVVLPGIVATIGALCAFALADGSIAQWIGLWIIYAFASIPIKTTVWTAAVAGSFTAARGMALGITLCGTAAAQAVLPPLANWLIADFGWRTAYVALGLGWGSMTWLLCWLFFVDRRLPGVQMGAAAPPTGEPLLQRPGLTIGEAWRSTALWRIALSTFLVMAVTIGFAIHQIAILGEAGVARTEAAWLASLAGLAGIAGKLVTGGLLDRYRSNLVGGITLMAGATAFLVLALGQPSLGLILFAMLVNGYTQGAKLQISSYLTISHAGLRHYGAIYGVMHALTVLGTAAGPLAAAYAYDRTGGYAPFLTCGAFLSLAGGLLILSLPAIAPDRGTV